MYGLGVFMEDNALVFVAITIRYTSLNLPVVYNLNNQNNRCLPPTQELFLQPKCRHCIHSNVSSSNT